MKSHKTVYKSRADETHFVCRRPSELSVIESTSSPRTIIARLLAHLTLRHRSGANQRRRDLLLLDELRGRRVHLLAGEGVHGEVLNHGPGSGLAGHREGVQQPFGDAVGVAVRAHPIETMFLPLPRIQSLRWSQMALAADAAEESLRAAMMPAPRF